MGSWPCLFAECAIAMCNCPPGDPGVRCIETTNWQGNRQSTNSMEGLPASSCFATFHHLDWLKNIIFYKEFVLMSTFTL